MSAKSTTPDLSLLEKAGIFIKKMRNTVYELIPTLPYSSNEDKEDDEEDNDKIASYDDQGVPYDQYGRILFGGNSQL
jgi:hypothetical protein